MRYPHLIRFIVINFMKILVHFAPPKQKSGKTLPLLYLHIAFPDFGHKLMRRVIAHFSVTVVHCRDFKNYRDLFDLMMSLVKLPDLMIYIRSSIPTLVAQIQKRGREYEQSMRLDYLEGLSRRYEEWISGYKGQLIIIDGDHCKFGENSDHFKQVTDMIDAKLYGLFPME